MNASPNKKQQHRPTGREASRATNINWRGHKGKARTGKYYQYILYSNIGIHKNQSKNWTLKS
jgi:hypothetical protein